jgi:hypothetical protein
MIAHLYATENESSATLTQHYAGELAYVDSFAGLIPCRVTRVYVKPGELPGLDKVCCDFTVTANRPGWKRGDRGSDTTDWVVPRASVRRRKYGLRIVNDYEWCVTP